MNDPRNTDGNDDQNQDGIEPDATVHESADQPSLQSGRSAQAGSADDQKADNGESAASESSSAPPSQLKPSETDSSLAQAAESGPRRSGRVVSIFALLLAVLALALASYPYWPVQIPGFAAPDQAAEAVAELEQSMDQLDRRSRAARQDLERQINAQDEVIGEMQSALEQLPEAMPQDRLESDLDARIESQVEAQLAVQHELQAQQEAVRSQQASDWRSQLNARIDAVSNELDQRIETLRNQQAAAEADRAEQFEMLEVRNRERFEQLSARLESVGQELDDTGQNVSERLLLIQIEALLALGQDRLELDADAAGASTAFQRALERLQSYPGVQQDTAAFNSLQQSIQRELGLIQQYRDERPERSPDQRFVRLNELAEQVPEWPDYAAQPASSAEQVDRAETEGWGARVGQALRGLVRIENVEQAQPSAPEVEQSRERIQQLLRAAALAGVQRDWNLNQVLIEAAQADMRNVLNTDDAAVRQALIELDQLKIAPARSMLPPLGQSRERVSELLERSQ